MPLVYVGLPYVFLALPLILRYTGSVLLPFAEHNPFSVSYWSALLPSRCSLIYVGCWVGVHCLFLPLR